MENQYNSKEDSDSGLEKLGIRWNLYANRVDVPKPQPFANKKSYNPQEKYLIFFRPSIKYGPFNNPKKSKNNFNDTEDVKSKKKLKQLKRGNKNET